MAAPVTYKNDTVTFTIKGISVKYNVKTHDFSVGGGGASVGYDVKTAGAVFELPVLGGGYKFEKTVNPADSSFDVKLIGGPFDMNFHFNANSEVTQMQGGLKFDANVGPVGVQGGSKITVKPLTSADGGVAFAVDTEVSIKGQAWGTQPGDLQFKWPQSFCIEAQNAAELARIFSGETPFGILR